jgi:hypothetical protein
MWHAWESREEVYKVFVGKPEGKKITWKTEA